MPKKDNSTLHVQASSGNKRNSAEGFGKTKTIGKDMKQVETEFGTITGRTPAGEEFVELFAESCEQARHTEKLFIKYVQSLGAVAAVKNDGWIKQKEKKFQVSSYAYFDHGIKEGDLVAIGEPYNYKMVVITEVEKTWWLTEYYHFRNKVL